MPRDGVLIAGFGGPDCPQAVGMFMQNLMGRPPEPELVARVRARYEAIGGCSPMLAIARQLADGVGDALGGEVPVAVGMRYWEPFIHVGVDSLLAAGVDRIALVSLSAYEAKVTHGEYRRAVQMALAGRPHVRVVEVPLLSQLPAFVDLHAEAASAAAADAPGAPIVFSAHSLPVGDVAGDDGYVRELQRAADAVAVRLGLPAGARGEILPGIEAFGSGDGERAWLVAYQSKGARGGEWLGPDVDDVTDAVARAGGIRIVVVPLGFATDHMETLYDLDVVSRQHAASKGVVFSRSAVPNADPRLSGAIATAVRDTLVSG